MPLDNPNQVPTGDLEILMDARGRISSHDAWVQGTFRDGERHCLVAALSLASLSRSFAVPNPTERRLTRLLAAEIPSTAPSLMKKTTLIPARHRLMWFNDDTRTSHDDVVALLDRAINNLVSEVPQYA